MTLGRAFHYFLPQLPHLENHAGNIAIYSKGFFVFFFLQSMKKLVLHFKSNFFSTVKYSQINTSKCCLGFDWKSG